MRYQRNLPVIGEKGQEKLVKSKVGIIGVGGIGSAAALYLAQAGASLVLIDKEEVMKNNLNRQVLYTEKDVGRPKVEAAVDRLLEANPEITVTGYFSDLESRYFKGCQFVVDGTDNIETRYRLNDELFGKIPFSYGGAIRMSGMVSTFVKGGPCLRCLYPKAEVPGCDVGGILGPVAGTIGLLEALEAIKSVTGVGDLLVGRLVRIDFENNDYRVLEYETQKGCLCQK